MHKIRCFRQVDINYFSFLQNFIEIIILAFWGFAGRKTRTILMEMNIDINNFEHSHISYGMH